MLPIILTNALHRRPRRRRLVLAWGYLGGAAALVYGFVRFWTGSMDDAMESGWWMVGGIFLWHFTAEAQSGSRNERCAACPQARSDRIPPPVDAVP